MIYGSHHALFTPGCEVLLKVQILRYTQYNFPEDEEYHLMPKNKLQELLKFLGCSEETVPKIQPGSVPKIQPESSKSEILKDEKSIDDETKYDVSSESNCNVALPVMKDAFDDNDNHVSGDEDEDSNEDEDSTEDEASDTEDIPQNDSAITCILECDPPALPDEQVDYKIFKVNDEALETCKYETNDNISTGVTGEIGLSIVKEQVDQNSGNVRPKRKRKQIKDLSESASFDNDSVSDGGIDAIKRSTRKKGRTEKNIKQGKSIKRAKRFSLTTKDRDGVECVKLVTKKELYVGKEYKCCECDFKTHDCGVFRQHTDVHKVKGVFLCKDCGNTILLYDNYKHHRSYTEQFGKCGKRKVIQKFHLELKCIKPRCKFVTSIPVDYVNHLVNKHKRKGNFECPIDFCGYKTPIRHTFWRHIVRHDANRATKNSCLFCEQKFAASNRLTVHLQNHCIPDSSKFNQLKFLVCRCSKCLFETFDHQQYCEHMRIMHSILEPFICPFEACVFKTCKFTDFTQHLVTHSRNGRHKCEVCGTFFVFAIELKRHNMKCHKQTCFNCTKCGYGDEQRSKVIKHHVDTHGQEAAEMMVIEGIHSSASAQGDDKKNLVKKYFVKLGSKAEISCEKGFIEQVESCIVKSSERQGSESKITTEEFSTEHKDISVESLLSSIDRSSITSPIEREIDKEQDSVDTSVEAPLIELLVDMDIVHSGLTK